ncbi:MAG: hypothetical protein P8X80_20740 [Desulfobacterales bacterium]
MNATVDISFSCRMKNEPPSLLFVFHEKIPFLQNIHPVVFGFILVVVACIFLNLLGEKRFGPTKRKKFNLSEQIPGLLIASVIVLIVIGAATKSKAVLMIAFVSFLPVWFYLAMRFSEIFYTDLGKIPFDDVTNIIDVNPDFTIFCNSYSLPNPRIKGKYLPVENQLCFRFLIRKCSGYHRILLRNDMSAVAGGLSFAMSGNSASAVRMNIPDIAENYIILSKSETEIKEIISKIQYVLRKLADIFPRNGGNFALDSVPANLDLHITRNEVLARIPYPKGWLIDRLYLSFKEMQSILSK